MNVEKKTETQKKFRKKHPEYYKKYYERHKAEIDSYKKQNRYKYKERIKQYGQKYNQEHKVRAEELRLKRRFNLSLEEVDAFLIKQQHKCPICKKSLRETQRCTDHDHKSGKVRGILCRLCNMGLGSFRDSLESLESAIQYLKK